VLARYVVKTARQINPVFSPITCCPAFLPDRSRQARRGILNLELHGASTAEMIATHPPQNMQRRAVARR